MARSVRKVLGGLLLLAAVGGIVAWATGAFSRAERVAPGKGVEPAGLPAPARTAPVRRESVPVVEEAVGTVRSATVVAVSSQVSAQVLEVKRRPGATVRKDEPLVVLDDRELVARKAQALQAVEAATAARRRAEQAKAQGEARLRQATLRNDRMKALAASKTVTPEVAEAAEADWLSAKAAVADAEASIAAADAQREQAAQVVAEAEIALSRTKIASPIDGVVSERAVEPGDLAWPGRTLLVVLDPAAQRLEARVRESLIARVGKDQALEVVVPAAGATAVGKVAEIVPSADPLSRTFTVRVDFGPVAGVHAGMFGRLRIPAGRRETVVVPRAAVARVGQLESVVVEEGGRWLRRLVATGLDVGADGVEVLSGLSGGETVGLPPEAAR